MPRAPFNTLMNVFAGPDTGTPLALVASDVPCRLVDYRHIVPRYAFVRGCVGYVTYDSADVTEAPSLRIGWDITLRQGFGSVLEIPAGSGEFYIQFHADWIDLDTRPDYKRAWLAVYTP